jgi:16S rRNA (guanine527-N7)-methyltransferase
MSDFNKEYFVELYMPLVEAALKDAPGGEIWRGIFTEDEVITRLHLICDSLLDNAKRFNLTAILEPSAVVEKHIIDSILPLVYIENEAGCILGGDDTGNGDISRKISPRIMDIGAGAGFPSLPLGSILCDRGYKFLAVDSTAKKVRHITETAERIGISRSFQGISARAEDLAHGNYGVKSEKAANAAHNKLRESFGIVTARAVAALPVLVELCGAFVEVGGYFASMKGKSDEEIADAAGGAKKMGFEPCRKIEYSLPCGDVRSIALYRKIRRTEIIYPRPFAKITAKPL